MAMLKIVVLLLCVGILNAKIYERCELARALLNKYGFPKDQIAVWVCIAYHESRYNTAAVNTQSGDHGIFQISQLWWCSPPGKGTGCHKPCSAFEDNDISDDVVCVKTIYNIQGFPAWTTYNAYCNGDVSSFTQGCF